MIELRENDVEVFKMLLYARTNENIQQDSDYIMGGNKISMKTPDLNHDSEMIKQQFDKIATDFTNH